jgi:hypothetical protein
MFVWIGRSPCLLLTTTIHPTFWPHSRDSTSSRAYQSRVLHFIELLIVLSLVSFVPSPPPAFTACRDDLDTSRSTLQPSFSSTLCAPQAHSQHNMGIAHVRWRVALCRGSLIQRSSQPQFWMIWGCNMCSPIIYTAKCSQSAKGTHRRKVVKDWLLGFWLCGSHWFRFCLKIHLASGRRLIRIVAMWKTLDNMADKIWAKPTGKAFFWGDQVGDARCVTPPPVWKCPQGFVFPEVCASNLVGGPRWEMCIRGGRTHL